MMSYQFLTPIYRVETIGNEFDQYQQECVAELLQGIPDGGVVTREILEDLIRTAFVDGLTRGLFHDI